MIIPKCENTTCTNQARLNKNGNKYLRHCSTACTNTCNSLSGAEKRKQTCLARYGSPSNLTSPSTVAKIKQTNLRVYGAEHAMQSKDVKQKVSDTKLEKYGDSTFNNREKFKETRSNFSDDKLESIKQNRISTCLEKYGVEFVTQTDDFKSKAAATNMNRYGVENAAASPEIKSKIADTMSRIYGCHYNQRHIKDDTLDKLSDIGFLQANKDRSLAAIAAELNVTWYTIGYAYQKFGVDRTFISGSQSTGEKEIVALLNQHNIFPEENVRGLIGKKELDIYIPDKNLAIEFHGLYWHTEGRGKDRNYHLNKTILCRDKGVSLIQVTDYEWLHRREIVQSRLLAKLGVTTKIHARKCQVREVSAKHSALFLKQTHIQGSAPGSVRLGLFLDNELVALMTFGKSRYNKNMQWELLRFSSILNHTIVGGASKLFSYFIRTFSPNTVISYCDLRWNTGTLYEKLGFLSNKSSGPNYWYTKQYASFESRVKYQKHKLEKILPIFDPAKTEWDNMQTNGYDRFWDCGNRVFLWTPK